MANTRSIDFPLVKQTYQERSPEMDNRKVVNYYISYDQDGTKPMMFNPTAGYVIKYILNLSTNSVRALYSDQNSAYSYALAFASNVVYLLSNSTRSIPVGEITTSGGFIGVTSSTSQVLFVDGAFGYVYDIAAQTITRITDDNFPINPLDAVFFNGYFVALEGQSNQWFVSDAGSALTWPDQNGVVFNAKADTLQGCAAVSNSLFIFGNYTTEVWYPQAQGTFPFSYNSNLLFEYGCIATGSIAEGQGVLIWLAGDKNGVGSVYMTLGTQPEKISTQAIDLAIRGFSRVDDAIGFIYKEAGHIFYQLTFPTANKTLLVDITPTNGDKTWVYLEQKDGDRHIANCHTYFNKQHLIGSYETASLYTLSSLILTNNGEIVRRSVQGATYESQTYVRSIFHKFEVNFQGGIGNINQPGEEPRAFLSVSLDEGSTFGHQRPAMLAKTGQYKYRTEWFGCGMGRSFTPRVDVYSAVPCYLLGAALIVTDGKS